MWQEEDSLNQTLTTTTTPSSDKRYPQSEPDSPEPESFHNHLPQLPSSTLPVDYSSRPAYTIGTRSHSYATEHRKTIPFPIPTTPSSPPSSTLASPAAESSSSS